MKDIKYGVLCFIPSVLLLVFCDSFPNEIATHFNFFGNADIYSSKWYIILLVPVLGFLGHVTYMVILEKRPNRIGRNGIKKYSFLYFPMLTCFAIIFMLWNI